MCRSGAEADRHTGRQTGEQVDRQSHNIHRQVLRIYRKPDLQVFVEYFSNSYFSICSFVCEYLCGGAVRWMDGLE